MLDDANEDFSSCRDCNDKINVATLLLTIKGEHREKKEMNQWIVQYCQTEYSWCGSYKTKIITYLCERCEVSITVAITRGECDTYPWSKLVVSYREGNCLYVVDVTRVEARMQTNNLECTLSKWGCLVTVLSWPRSDLRSRFKLKVENPIVLMLSVAKTIKDSRILNRDWMSTRVYRRESHNSGWQTPNERMCAIALHTQTSHDRTTCPGQVQIDLDVICSKRTDDLRSNTGLCNHLTSPCGSTWKVTGVCEAITQLYLSMFAI